MPTRGARALVIRATLIYFARRRSNAEILVRDRRASLTSRTRRLPNTSTAWVGGVWWPLIRNDRTDVCWRSDIREKIKAFQFLLAERRSQAVIEMTEVFGCTHACRRDAPAQTLRLRSNHPQSGEASSPAQPVRSPHLIRTPRYAPAHSDAFRMIATGPGQIAQSGRRGVFVEAGISVRRNGTPTRGSASRLIFSLILATIPAADNKTCSLLATEMA
jgi:hypothetical protein